MRSTFCFQHFCILSFLHLVNKLTTRAVRSLACVKRESYVCGGGGVTRCGQDDNKALLNDKVALLAPGTPAQ